MIHAHFSHLQPLKWELKQKPGLSPPCGGYNSDDPTQQIVAEEIFGEYGGKTNNHNLGFDFCVIYRYNYTAFSQQKSSDECMHFLKWIVHGYVGFLEGGAIPDLLANFTARKHEKKRPKRKSKHKQQSTATLSDSSLSESDSSERNQKRKNIRRNSQNPESPVRITGVSTLIPKKINRGRVKENSTQVQSTMRRESNSKEKTSVLFRMES